MKNAIHFKRVVLSCTIVFLFLSLSHSHCYAITKAELFFELFTELGYAVKEENPSLPIDVPPTHRYAREIGISVRGEISPAVLGINEGYRDEILEEMLASGYVKGFKVKQYISGKVVTPVCGPPAPAVERNGQGEDE